MVSGALSALPAAQTHPLPPSRTPSSAQLHSLTGVVTDPSGAVIADTPVALEPIAPASSSAAPIEGKTDSVGRYILRVPPGAYILHVKASGFAPFDSPPIELGSDPTDTLRVRQLDVKMELAVEIQQMDVFDDPASSRSAASFVLSRHDIDTLPLDSAAMLDQLRSLAGGPDAALFVDGFSGTRMPPRSQIREIRINQNPYSAQNDINPINGTIQVLTRPGTDRFHGDFYLSGDLSQLNAKNPFAPGQPPYYAFASESTVSGRLRRNASYVVTLADNENRLNSLVNASAIAASREPVSEAIASPYSSIVFSPRLDLQPAQHSTLNLRYTLTRTQQTNGGVGQLALPAQAFTNTMFNNALQISNSQVIGEHLVNDTRLQYSRTDTTQTPANQTPAIIVEGLFFNGGNTSGNISDHQDHLELQNNIALSAGPHYINTGARLRVAHEANHFLQYSNGEFVFSSLADYQSARTTGAHTATQFVYSTGNPNAHAAVADVGAFAQDDWKIKPNLTFSYGARFESESYVPDHIDWAPRVGVSYSFGRPSPNAAPRYVVRFGAGFFYSRFALDSALTINRQNGILQQEYIVTSPAFCCEIPIPQILGAQATPTIYRISQRYRSPYYMGSTISLERTIGRLGTISVSWLNNRGVHTPLLENANSPLPGTYNVDVPGSGIRPLGSDNLYEFATDGVFRSSRLSSTINLHSGRYALYGYYMLRFDKSDALAGTFPSNSYNVGGDYGRADDDTRHAVTVRGSAQLPRAFYVSGYVRAVSGQPFNIVVPQDLNGDTLFNDRPAFATDLTRPSVVRTPWGAFDTSPLPSQTIIPRNYGEGPMYVLVSLAAGRSFGLGPSVIQPGAKTPPTHRASLDLWAESQNLLNHPNYGTPVGVLGSPLFGQSLSLTAASTISPDRIVDLQLSIRF